MLTLLGAMGAASRAAAAPHAATLPATSCSLVSGARACDLWAKTGTLTLPGLSSPVTIWGYSATSGGAAGLPGPTLIVNQGETVNVTLHNTLSQASSLSFPGQALAPDTAGAAAGGTKTYSFVASAPGTYLYEAGMTANGTRQVAMGLFGALVVRPSTNPTTTAYGTAASTYVDEALLVLSEIDTNLNSAPTTFSMTKFNPNFWLINGKAYPSTDAIPVAAGDKVLLRYVNASVQPLSMGALGLRQTVLATDGAALPFARTVIAETIGAGQTLDVIASIPATAPAGAKYAVYNANGQPRNASQRSTGVLNFGGMMTFLTVGGTSSGGSTPVTSNVAFSQSPTNGTVNITLSASVSNAPTAAEYFVDAVGANGAGCAMSVSAGTASATIPASGGSAPCANLTSLASGSHTFYVHGQNGSGWGAVSSGTLVLDKKGPDVSGMALTPPASNGTVAVAIQATASDAANGNSNVVAAEYTIDGGAAQAMSVSASAPTASLNATIAQATANALTAGNHTISIRARDALNNWGAPNTITLLVDKTGPAAPTLVSASPNPNNGTTPFNSSVNAVRMFATLSDAATAIATGEGFIDTLGAQGAGFPFQAVDGVFNSSNEPAYADIPLPTVSLLASGNHTLYVRGKDTAGNWGPATSITLVIDKIGPTLTTPVVTPNPAVAVNSVTLTTTATDAAPSSNIVAAEYYIDTDPGIGSATTLTIASPAATVNLNASINVSALATGTHTIGVRVRDGANNWSTTGTRSFSLVPDTIFSDSFQSGNFSAWGTGGGAGPSTTNTTRLRVLAAASLNGTPVFGMQAQGNNTNYVQYNFGTTANPASATYDARFYFNPNGNNTSTTQDIFVAQTTSGTTLFRVRYRWNSSTPQVQIQIGTSTTNTTWTNINNNFSNVIEVVWQTTGSGGPNPGTLRLYVNSTSLFAQSLNNTNTVSNGAVGRLRLGSVTTGSSSTLMYFDAFSSKRSVASLIGP
jgi:FtsP/CotA-like multicopper oxidase with cupredoxin domain